MSTAKWRLRILHATNALLTLALIATGFLITYPDLRAELIGGYALQLSKLHRSSALLYLGIPTLIFVTAPLAVGRNIGWRVWSIDRSRWQQVHLRCYLLAVVAVILSGALMWLDIQWSPAILDATAAVHLGASWLIVASIPLHLATIARRALAGDYRRQAQGPGQGD